MQIEEIYSVTNVVAIKLKNHHDEFLDYCDFRAERTRTEL
jgi:hypothetical protein